jgi:hypothetical protein
LKKINKLLVSLVAGVIVTLITGLVQNKVLIGATHYGWPIAWRIIRVLAPEHNPLKIIPLWFVIDTAFWAIIFYLIFHYTRNQ